MGADGSATDVKRILVTGASGFVGAHVVRRLAAAGHDVTSIGIDDGDLADQKVAARVLTPWRWDAVIDLAGPVTSGNEDLPTGIDVVTAHANIALNVRQYASDARIVHASSMTVYGTPTRIDVDEEHPRRPLHLYGLAKRIAEDVLLADAARDVWVLRLPGLFSEHRKGGALYHFCRAARAGEPLVINASAPTAWNILHVDDAADALVRAATAPTRAGGALNIAYAEPVDLVSVATTIASFTGARVDNTAGIAHPAMRLVSAKAARLIDWSPPTLAERLARLYEAYAAA